MTSKKFAIIGAGAAGLAAIRVLTEAGHEVTCFEADDKIGGHWNYDYQALHLITAKSASMYRGFPQPEDYPIFPSRIQILKYLNGFADIFNLRERIRFNTRIAKAVPLGDHGLEGWEVTTEPGRTEHFDALVVANGHLRNPYRAPLPGRFDGKIVHSSEYQTTADIEGQRVLVIGAGNSGCDLAADAAQARFEVDICIRRGAVFQPKTFFGKPRAELPLKKLPARAQELVLRFLVWASLGHPETYPGMPKPPTRNLNNLRPIVNNLLPYWIQHGRIKVKPAIRTVEGKKITFIDDSSAFYDTILMATGFRYETDFLSDSGIALREDMPDRWAAGLIPEKHANIFFLGLIAPAGAQFPIYEQQCDIILELIDAQDRISRPINEDFVGREEPFTLLETKPHIWNGMRVSARKILEEVQTRSLPLPRRMPLEQSNPGQQPSNHLSRT